jgi:hypothetical protein
MSNLAHLDEALHSVVELPADERIQRVRQPHWIGYTRSKRILEKLVDLLSYPRVDRMPNLLIVGETNNGKTMIASRFQRLHPASDEANGDHALVPVLLVQAPPVPDESRFYGAILEGLGAPYKPRGSVLEKQVQVLHLLRGIQLRMLVIDEIHHILAGHIAKQRQFLNVLKHLGNELRIPLVGVGTIECCTRHSNRSAIGQPVRAGRTATLGDEPRVPDVARQFRAHFAVAAAVPAGRTCHGREASGSQRRDHWRAVLLANGRHDSCHPKRHRKDR